MTTRIVFIVLTFVSLLAYAKEPRTTADIFRQGPDGVAIDGYSAVSYFTNGRAEMGAPEFSVAFDGLTYWFTDTFQVSAFEADPRRFAPAHGGWCSLMLTGSGNLAVADPRTFKIVDGRLLLFWSGEFNGQAVDGLRNWESKFDEADGERDLLAKADRTWDKLLSGKKAEKLLFFQAADARRVNDERREAGKKMYQ